jgi:hypothetical protein
VDSDDLDETDLRVGGGGGHAKRLKTWTLDAAWMMVVMKMTVVVVRRRRNMIRMKVRLVHPEHVSHARHHDEMNENDYLDHHHEVYLVAMTVVVVVVAIHLFRDGSFPGHHASDPPPFESYHKGPYHASESSS